MDSINEVLAVSEAGYTWGGKTGPKVDPELPALNRSGYGWGD